MCVPVLLFFSVIYVVKHDKKHVDPNMDWSDVEDSENGEKVENRGVTVDIDECVDGVHDRSGMMIVLKVVLILRETEFFWEACDEYVLSKTYYEMWFNYYYYCCCCC